jgi:hypothetical protein
MDKTVAVTAGGLPTLTRSRAEFTLAYRLEGHKVVNDGNLLKLPGNVLSTSLAYYYRPLRACIQIARTHTELDTETKAVSNVSND